VVILEQKVVNYAIYTKVYYAEIYQFAQDLLHQCKKKKNFEEMDVPRQIYHKDNS
jgi:hypothetical protein